MGDTLEAMRELEPRTFERLVAHVWEEHGWETEVSDPGPDAGVDVVATQETPTPQKVVIQAKRYSSDRSVTAEEIQQYASLRRQTAADSVAVVTTSSFTRPAEKRAESLDVRLVDGRELRDMVEDVGLPQPWEEADLEAALEPETGEPERDLTEEVGWKFGTFLGYLWSEAQRLFSGRR